MSAGGIPNDEPSAGVTMMNAMASPYTALPERRHTAMTIEVTLTGVVSPIIAGIVSLRVLCDVNFGVNKTALLTFP